MEKESFEKLIADKPSSVKAKGVTLFNGYLSTLKAYQDSPTASQLKDWQSSEAALNEFISSIGEVSESFVSIADVLNYLGETGWRVTKRSLYRHHKEGKFVPRDNGAYRKSDIERYAKTWLKQQSTGKRLQEDTDALQRKKLERELERLAIEIKQKQLIYEKDAGHLVPREQMEIELAGRASILDAGLKHWIHSQAMEWVRVIGGDVKRVGEFIHILTYSLDEHINTYANAKDYLIVIDDIDDEETVESEAVDPG